MTARPPFDEHDALDPEVRELAARLAALDAGGPSAALDARILAAARAAVAPAMAPPARRRVRRWPTAIGAAATLVIAVGLAWQLKPLLDLPPPMPRQPPSVASADAEVLAHAESLPAPPAAAPVERAASDSAATAPVTAAAPVRARGAATNGVATRAAKVQPQAHAEAAVAPVSDDFVDEAVGHHADAANTAAVIPPAAAPPAAVATQAEERAQFMESRAAAARQAQESDLDRITVSGSRIARPVADDASLPPLEWLERIRERRDGGDMDGARASLQRFVREYPRHRLPDDLRALRDAPR